MKSIRNYLKEQESYSIVLYWPDKTCCNLEVFTYLMNSADTSLLEYHLFLSLQYSLKRKEISCLKNYKRSVDQIFAVKDLTKKSYKVAWKMADNSKTKLAPKIK